jgi:D-methionine transport system ATP-binding protein
MNIRLEGLAKTYQAAGRGKKKKDSAESEIIHAVAGVSLDIPGNVIYGVIGKSGAGKSTLVRLMSLLEKPDAGALYYDDKRVEALQGKDLVARRRRNGMIFQSFGLFSSRNAAENIAYPMEIDKNGPYSQSKASIKARTEELLGLVGLEGRGEAPISTLSGGQKQRIAIARALANNPDILFCDEATSALDPQTTHSILALIRDLKKRLSLTVVMITHQMEVVRDACDIVSVLDAGKVVETGSVEDIFTRPRHVVTRDFLAHLSPENDSGSSPAKSGAQAGTAAPSEDGLSPDGLIHWSKEGGHYLLRFVGDKTGQPVMSQLARRFKLDFNIRAGGVQHIEAAGEKGARDVGTLAVDFKGEDSEIDSAFAWLREQGIIIDEEE